MLEGGSDEGSDYRHGPMSATECVGRRKQAQQIDLKIKRPYGAPAVQVWARCVCDGKVLDKLGKPEDLGGANKLEADLLNPLLEMVPSGGFSGARGPGLNNLPSKQWKDLSGDRAQQQPDLARGLPPELPKLQRPPRLPEPPKSPEPKGKPEEEKKFPVIPAVEKAMASPRPSAGGGGGRPAAKSGQRPPATDKDLPSGEPGSRPAPDGSGGASRPAGGPEAVPEDAQPPSDEPVDAETGPIEEGGPALPPPVPDLPAKKALDAAIALLRGTETGRRMLAVLARADPGWETATSGPGELVVYFPQGNRLLVDAKAAAGVGTTELAARLAHEAQHAAQVRDGLKLVRIQGEYEAHLVSAHFLAELKEEPAKDLPAWIQDEISLWRKNPARLLTHIKKRYSMKEKLKVPPDFYQAHYTAAKLECRKDPGADRREGFRIVCWHEAEELDRWDSHFERFLKRHEPRVDPAEFLPKGGSL